MNVEEKIIEILKKNDIRKVITVPCKFFSLLLERLKSEPSIKIIWPAREEEGFGISAGCYLGGMKSILLIQNSGLGNSINVIKSLYQYYNIPFFAIVSHRGGPEEKIEAQRPMGELTPNLLKLLGIRYEVLESAGDVDKIDGQIKHSFTNKESSVLLARPSFWKKI